MARKKYIPNSNDIIWLDFDPTVGKEIGKYRPALVLTSELYNEKTSLLICCPISTSIRGLISEVPLDCLDKPSVVVSSILQTYSWKERKVKFIEKAKNEVMIKVYERVLPLIGATQFFDITKKYSS